MSKFLNDRKNIFLLPNRINHLEENAVEKLHYLYDQPFLTKPPYIMPDLADDSFILSGISIQTKDYFFPLSGGSDLGCGYRVLHSPLKKKDLCHLEDQLLMLADTVISPSETSLSKWLFELFAKKKPIIIN